MWWMALAGTVAVLIVFYITGKRAIARDKANDAAAPRVGDDAILMSNFAAAADYGRRSADNVDPQEVVLYASTFHGHFVNDGLDTLLDVMNSRELRLTTMDEALKAIGAEQIVPLLNEASFEFERYARESEVLVAPSGSSEQQTHVKAYLGRMRELETAIGKLDLNVDQLSRNYARNCGIA